MLAFCCNDHTEIPDGWYDKASPQIYFTSCVTKILRNFLPPVNTSMKLGSELQFVQGSCSAAV